MNRITIGVAGTAKNTGKTTTFNAVLRHLRNRGRERLITSIGYDGEDLDNVTGLPKPKVFVERGDTVVTALPLIIGSNAVFDEPSFTGVECALGPVFLARVLQGGQAVIAGPTGTKDVAEVLSYADRAMPEGSEERVNMLDGAFSRISPMVHATHLLIATGAAKYQFPGFISQDMEELAAVLNLPPHDESIADLLFPDGLYEDEQVKGIADALTSSRSPVRCAIHGIVAPEPFSKLLSSLSGSVHVTFVFLHPILLLLSGDKGLWRGALTTASRSGHKVVVRNTLRFLGFTVSPYLPVYHPERREYVATYASPREFLNEIRDRTVLPTTDIMLEGTKTLESWVDSVINHS